MLFFWDEGCHSPSRLWWNYMSLPDDDYQFPEKLKHERVVLIYPVWHVIQTWCYGRSCLVYHLPQFRPFGWWGIKLGGQFKQSEAHVLVSQEEWSSLCCVAVLGDAQWVPVSHSSPPADSWQTWRGPGRTCIMYLLLSPSVSLGMSFLWTISPNDTPHHHFVNDVAKEVPIKPFTAIKVIKKKWRLQENFLVWQDPNNVVNDD